MIVQVKQRVQCTALSPSGIRMRWDAGYSATVRALEEAAWQGEFDPLEGVILHESKPDLAMAAE